MKLCKQCNTPINDGYTYCYACFQKLADTKKKPKNGHEPKGIDIHKTYKLEMWVLAAIFVAGIVIGAWLW
jgi:hypothetical protein